MQVTRLVPNLSVTKVTSVGFPTRTVQLPAAHRPGTSRPWSQRPTYERKGKNRNTTNFLRLRSSRLKDEVNDSWDDSRRLTVDRVGVTSGTVRNIRPYWRVSQRNVFFRHKQEDTNHTGKLSNPLWCTVTSTFPDRKRKGRKRKHGRSVPTCPLRLVLSPSRTFNLGFPG